jgi:hypothetical protein
MLSYKWSSYQNNTPKIKQVHYYLEVTVCFVFLCYDIQYIFKVGIPAFFYENVALQPGETFGRFVCNNKINN